MDGQCQVHVGDGKGRAAAAVICVKETNGMDGQRQPNQQEKIRHTRDMRTCCCTWKCHVVVVVGVDRFRGA